MILGTDSPPSQTASISESSVAPSTKHQDDEVR